MKGFFRNVSPRRAVLDLWQVMGAPSEFRARALILAALVTGGIFYLMTQQEGRGLPKPPTIIYFESWRADRSDAEILKGNIEAQKKADAEEAAEEQRQEDIRKMYKAVGAATGIDTQKMYDDGTKERAAEKKAESEKNAALYRQITGKPVPTAPGLDTHKP
ncbi:hypothetical protein [Novosphingobium pokkalii]|uniref:Uncharacterized protein n=1 Tax=Novosphingobium pokkalii TaxID=1770194 RepID=A0ABV7V571_9SPHN|nr:hypothetical protein [Novosphingobium pokkalii]GHC89040.1 hypothetical protein GCM10019060_12340 [Novosphingobium pokkalii]